MESGRELLELAAKAMGAQLNYATGPGLQPQPWIRLGVHDYYWNPLTDDGDALRLAVKISGLNLQWIIAEAWQAHDNHAGRCAYVRRAIVRAAAAIGKDMP